MFKNILQHIDKIIQPFKRTNNTSDIIHLLSSAIQPKLFLDKEILLKDVHRILDKTWFYASYDINIFEQPSSQHLIIIGNTYNDNEPIDDPAFKHAKELYQLKDNQEFVFSYTYAGQRNKPDILDEGQADLIGKLQWNWLWLEILESIYKQASKAGYKYVVGMHLKPRLVKYFSSTKPYRVPMNQLPIEIQNYLTDSGDPTKHETTVALLDKIDTISQ